MRLTRKSVWWVVVVLLAVVGLAACGDDGDGSAPDTPTPGSPDSGTDASDGSDGSSGGSADVGDFPIAAPDGLLLDALADAGIPMAGQRQLYYPNDDFDRVVAFYDEWTTENGEWSKGESGGVVVYQRLDSEGIESITITPDHDPGAQADGLVTFALLVSG